MAPTTRASTRKTALADSRDIVSWASAATGEILYYERFHCYEEEGEVLFVQMRMDEHGQLVPWTTDIEDEDEDAVMTDGGYSEEGEVDADFIPEAEHVQRRQTTKVNKFTPLPAASHHAPPPPAISLHAFLLSLAAGFAPQQSLPAAPLPAAPAINIVDDMANLVEDEFILNLAIGPLSETVLLATSQSSLSSMLRNFWVSDLSEVNGARAHAVEKEAYDLVRPGKTVNGRWVLDPRHNMFRPSNREYKVVAEMGP